MGKNKKGLICFLVLSSVVVLLNVIAWNSTAFCDAYIKYVFPLWVNTYGRVTGLFPFSVGEILLFLGAFLMLFAVLLGIMVFLVILQTGISVKWDSYRIQKNKVLSQNRILWENRAVSKSNYIVNKKLSSKNRQSWRPKFWKFIRKFYQFFAWTLLGVSFVMTLNCSILYHASTFSQQYFGEETQAYTLEELCSVRNYVVEQCNQLSMEMDRDEDGTILYKEDMKKTAIHSMKALGQTYSQLDGYYPNPKPLATSDFFCQQYMCGYYFPFSMEANYNDVMYIMNKPSTMCHELAHLRGYIYEDEANFISYLACVQSDDKVFQYSGFLSVLSYLDNDFYKAIGKDQEIYFSQPVITQQVMEDNVFVTQEEWDRINAKAVIDTETVDQVSDVLVDATLKANGVSDGTISYSRVVRLLLQYYQRVDKETL